jgi:hypothetical protein
MELLTNRYSENIVGVSALVGVPLFYQNKSRYPKADVGLVNKHYQE